MRRCAGAPARARPQPHPHRSRNLTGTTIDARSALVFLVGFAAAITVHEFCHALAAFLLGDQTAQREGRLSLNPLKHLDPIGTLLPVLAALSGAPGFGWGKPVPVDPRRLRWGRIGMAVVSVAGPTSNVVLAILAAFVFRLVAAGVLTVPELGLDFLSGLVILNISLAVFNILPVAPLDGFGVASAFLPRPVASWLARYGPGVLLLLIAAPFVIRRDILGEILNPLRRALLAFVQQVAGVG
ncbi:MAG TPA: site-2 protease family protein [Chloroflexota bacterium]|nr:site-2 protease family protein [Chloroflexota bacterium]